MSYIPWLLFEKTVPGVQENGARGSVSGGSAPSIRSVPGGLRAKTLWDPGPNIDIDMYYIIQYVCIKYVFHMYLYGHLFFVIWLEINPGRMLTRKM